MNRLAIGRWIMALALGGLQVELSAVCADEGMWLFNNPPRRQLKERYSFEPTGAWLEHLQRSSVRFNSGGSGSFVSSQGLVMTNHHVGAETLQKVGTKEHDYLKVGFYAKHREEEIKALDLELNVLQSIEDVTARVNAAVKPGTKPADAFLARRAIMNTIEKESLDKTGLRSDVITLYHGGLYHLYRYKRYTDIRLVFAPESDIAFFGGDPDNFEYPRYDLDICFFRVYENGRPAKIDDYLRWSAAGAADGELVFVSGHPGRTDRLNTVAHLEYLRDFAIPHLMQKVYRHDVLLSTYSQRGVENARRAKDELFMVQNTRKAKIGGLIGLQDPAVMGRKKADEDRLRQAVQDDPQLRVSCGAAWGQISGTLETLRPIMVPLDLLEHGAAFNSHLFQLARIIVRLADESDKPNPQRLREYRESNLESLKQLLFSTAPVYDDLEIAKLADSLSMYIEMAGAADPLVRKVLAGKSPQDQAAELISQSHLKDVETRKKLVAGGKKAVAASHDPLIELVRLIDPQARDLRHAFEEKVEEPQRQAYARLARARFALEGTRVYPDATFTLRLAFGRVQGYSQQGQAIPPWTTLGGAYQHAQNHGDREPFALPKLWLERKERLDLATPFNTVNTADIIGGNSGSPVVNRNNELVGIIFDGNLESLVWDYVYSDTVGRSLAVHSSAIREALRKVYDAGPLADELGR